MRACGLITEYNPFHQGHLYHLRKSKQITKAHCTISVMSGNFLQRGEPAIIDKFHRTNAALQAGVDLVIELPYIFAVQNSDFFAKGAVSTLASLGVSSICFGSEKGDIESFVYSYHKWKKEQPAYQEVLHAQLNEGLSFPEASRAAYKQIGLTGEGIDLSKPNNILGYSYVKEIMEENHPIQPCTLQRLHNDYHDAAINGIISSATSIRKEMLKTGTLTPKTKAAVTESTITSLNEYKQTSGIWHEWEIYFPFVQYKVSTMTTDELNAIHGMEEGLEFRLKSTARDAVSFDDWIRKIKTKRYTWTRLQRLFVHLLVNCKKDDISPYLTEGSPYIRVLGMSRTGQNYLNGIKKQLDIPLFSQLQQIDHPVAELEERAAEAYYSALPPKLKKKLIQQEYMPPIMAE